MLASRLVQISQKRIGMIDHADLTYALETPIGFNYHEREITPGSTHDQGSDSTDSHSVLLFFARYKTLLLHGKLARGSIRRVKNGSSRARFLALSQLSFDPRDHPGGNGEIRGQMSGGMRGGIDLTASRQNHPK